MLSQSRPFAYPRVSSDAQAVDLSTSPAAVLPLAEEMSQEEQDRRWTAWVEKNRRTAKVSNEKLRTIAMGVAVVVLLCGAVALMTIR